MLSPGSLHSTVVLLKVSCYNPGSKPHLPLHSTVVLLKGEEQLFYPGRNSSLHSTVVLLKAVLFKTLNSLVL